MAISVTGEMKHTRTFLKTSFFNVKAYLWFDHSKRLTEYSCSLTRGNLSSGDHRIARGKSGGRVTGLVDLSNPSGQSRPWEEHLLNDTSHLPDEEE